MRTKLTAANSATNCLDKDATLEIDNITLAFSDRVWTGSWLVEKLRTTSFAAAKNSLGFLQLLTPDREALAGVAGADSQVKSLIMANTTSSTAQLDASKSSAMCCAGRLSTFWHTCEAFCNLRLLLGVVVDNPDASLLVQKLHEYSLLLVDRQGRLFFEACCEQPHLAVHPFQDVQHILSAFWTVASMADIYQTVAKGEGVAISNYTNAIAVADGAITDLRAIIHGNGLGKFSGLPCCAPWFPGTASA